MNEKLYYVYIMMNEWETVSYVGITNDLIKRVGQHKDKSMKGFTARYNLRKLVYFETFQDPTSAIEREKQIKRWRRDKKLQMIRTKNPAFKDLFDDL